MNTALRLIKMLMVMMMNRRRIRMRPCIKRSSVKANELLLYVAARIEKVPVRLPMTSKTGKLAGGTA